MIFNLAVSIRPDFIKIYVLVYAPRTAEEVPTVVRILGASHAFARSAS